MLIKPVRRWRQMAGLVAAAFALPTASPAAEPAFAIELEVGPVWQSGNTVQIPNDQDGTRFSLEQLVGSGPWPAARFYFNWDINERNGLRLVVAPLSYTESGVFDETVNFNGASFLPGVPTEATYKFNSWRLGYRYRFHQGKRWTWWVGATANVRDAKIELQQGNTTSRDTDVGFVPLLYLSGTVKIAPRWRMLFDFEGLAGGPGRVEDLALKFAWFNAAVISGVYRF